MQTGGTDWTKTTDLPDPEVDTLKKQEPKNEKNLSCKTDDRLQASDLFQVMETNQTY